MSQNRQLLEQLLERICSLSGPLDPNTLGAILEISKYLDAPERAEVETLRRKVQELEEKLNTILSAVNFRSRPAQPARSVGARAREGEAQTF